MHSQLQPSTFEKPLAGPPSMVFAPFLYNKHLKSQRSQRFENLDAVHWRQERSAPGAVVSYCSGGRATKFFQRYSDVKNGSTRGGAPTTVKGAKFAKLSAVC